MSRPRNSSPNSRLSDADAASDRSSGRGPSGSLSFAHVTDEQWLRQRTFTGADFDPERLVAAKRAAGVTVSACLPALNVAETIGPIVAGIRTHWMDAMPLVDELVIVDSHSTDATVRIAREAGGVVHQDDGILPECGPGRGKGEAMWKSLAVSTGDVVCWIDTDIVDFTPDFVPGLLGPLITDPAIGFVKAIYHRMIGNSNDGGRVTEICARPLINLFYPELAGLAQPLAGEQAGRRDLLERIPFFTGYAVELGLLIDVLSAAGRPAIAQVDLGGRSHVNQPTAALGQMAFAIQHAVLQRLARDGRVPESLARPGRYSRPVRDHGAWEMTATVLAPAERPPIRDIPAYLAGHAV
jgi:glucosyl-3-phosphoglycerate synthase